MSSLDTKVSDELVNGVAAKLLENNEFLKKVGNASYSWVADCLLAGAAVSLRGSITFTRTTKIVQIPYDSGKTY